MLKALVDEHLADRSTLTGAIVPARAKGTDNCSEERWPEESGRLDKWEFCLKAAMMAADQEKT